MDDDDNQSGWWDKVLAWAIQLFEFGWNGASGAVAVGAIFMKPPARVTAGGFFVGSIG